MLQLIFGVLVQRVLSVCTPPSYSLFSSPITLNAPTTSELQQALYQFTSNQADITSSSGFFKPTLPYLLPLAIISAISLGLIIAIVWRKIKKEPSIDIGNNQCYKRCYFTVALVVLLIGLGLIAVSILNIFTTLSTSQQLQYLNCTATQKLNGYYTGSGENWIGSDNLASNVSTLRQLRNGLKGFTTNLSRLGIPINATYATMKLNIQTNMQAWLTRNSSVSSTILAPVCRTTPYTVPNPLDNTQTVYFPMMSTICSNLTQQSNNLIQNAASLDYLLSNYTSLIANLSNINSSLNTLSTSYDSFQTSLQNYNTSNLVIPYLSYYSSIAILSYASSGVSILTGIFIITFVILILTKQKSTTISIITSITNFLLFSLIIMSSVTCIYYLLEATAFKYMSTLYQKLPSSQLYSSLNTIYSFPSTVSNPIYTCATSPTDKFLSPDMSTLKTFTTLKQLYQNSTPPDILDSLAIAYTNLSLEYLSDLSKLSVSDTSINLTSLLNSINLLASYNLTNSTQSPCNAALDQFYFNGLNCTSQILDPSNVTEITIRGPRCIQIPTGQRQSGSNLTSLNQVQNVYNISVAPCNSMGNLFNNTACFFQQRISTLFASSDCAAKGASLSTSIKNLVKFSTSAGDVWDVYAQNLRNYVGVYLTLNSNISAFYTTSNVSQMFDSFSVPAANVIDNSGCSYIYSSVYNVYSQISNSISYFLKVVVLTFSIAIGSFVLIIGVWQLQKRIPMDEKIKKMKKRHSKKGSKIEPQLDDRNIKLEETMEQIQDHRLPTQQPLFLTPKIQRTKKKSKKENQLVEQEKKINTQNKKNESKNEINNREKSKTQKVQQQYPVEKKQTISQIQENSADVGQFPIQPIDFSQQEHKQKQQNHQSTKHKQLTSNKNTGIRPGEFASSSVKNIRNLILFDQQNRKQEIGKDNIIIEDLGSYDFEDQQNSNQPSVQNDQNQKKQENQDAEGSWVSATLSEPQNK